MSVLHDANQQLLGRLQGIFPGLLSETNSFGQSAIETPTISMQLSAPDTAAATSSQSPMPELLINAGDYSRNIVLALARSIEILDSKLSVSAALRLMLALKMGYGDGKIIQNCLDYLDTVWIPKVIDESSYQAALALQEYFNTLLDPANNILDFSETSASLLPYAEQGRQMLLPMKARLDARIKAYEVHIKDFNLQLNFRILELEVDKATSSLNAFMDLLSVEFQTLTLSAQDDLNCLKQKETALLTLQNNLSAPLFDEQVEQFCTVMADLNNKIAACSFPDSIQRNALLVKQLDAIIKKSSTDVQQYSSLIQEGLTPEPPAHQIHSINVQQRLFIDVAVIATAQSMIRDEYQRVVSQRLQQCREAQARLMNSPVQSNLTPRQVELMSKINALQNILPELEALNTRTAANEQKKASLAQRQLDLAGEKSIALSAKAELSELNPGAAVGSPDLSNLHYLFGIDPETDASRELETDFEQMGKVDSGLSSWMSVFSSSKAALIEKWTAKKTTRLQQLDDALAAMRHQEDEIRQEAEALTDERSQQHVSRERLQAMAKEKQDAEQELEAITAEQRVVAVQNTMVLASASPAWPAPDHIEPARPPIKPLQAYYSHMDRIHFWSEATTESKNKQSNRVFQFLLQPADKALRGDALKSRILGQLREDINQCRDADALERLERKIKGSAEEQILETSQGFLTSIMGRTDSIKALTNMLQDKRNLLQGKSMCEFN